MLMLTGLGLIVYGVLFYYGAGSYVFIGAYGDLPVAQYRGWGPAVPVGFLMIAVGAWFFAEASMGTPRFTRIHLAALLTTITIPMIMVGSGILYHNQSTYFYGGYTDAYILQVAAAETLVGGGNPYNQSYRGLIYEYIVTGRALGQATWLYRGGAASYNISDVVGFVDIYDYPAAGFLYYVPAVLLGVPGVVWDGLIYGLGLGLTYYRLRDRRARMIYPLVIGAGGFTLLTMPLIYTGLPGWITPFIIALLYPGNPLLAGALIGWMISYRPYTLVYALFYLVMYWREGYDWRRLLLYSTASAALINAPFLIGDPRGFIGHVLAPLTYNLYPYEGFGVSSLHYLGVDISKPVSIMLLLVVLGASLVAYWKYYGRLRILGPLLPLVVLLFYYRPLYGYYLWAPYFAVIAYLSGFYRGFGTLRDWRIDPRYLSVIGLLSTYAGIVGGGYMLSIGVYFLIGLLGILAYALIPIIIWVSRKGLLRPVKGRTGLILIAVLMTVFSIAVAVLLPHHFMVVIDRSKPEALDLLAYSASHVLAGGGNPYTGGIGPINASRISVYLYDHGFHRVSQYPPIGLYYSGPGCNGSCSISFATGFPAPLILGVPGALLGLPGLPSSLLLTALLFIVGYYWARRGDGLLYGLLISSMAMFFLLAPSNYPVGIWFSSLAFLAQLRGRIGSAKWLVDLLLILYGVAGLFMVIYYWVKTGVNRRFIVSVAAASLLLLIVFLVSSPWITVARMLAGYASSTTIPAYTLSYLAPASISDQPWNSPIISLLGVLTGALLLWAFYRGAKILATSLLIPYTMLPCSAAQLAGPPLLLDDSARNE